MIFLRWLGSLYQEGREEKNELKVNVWTWERWPCKVTLHTWGKEHRGNRCVPGSTQGGLSRKPTHPWYILQWASLLSDPCSQYAHIFPPFSLVPLPLLFQQASRCYWVQWPSRLWAPTFSLGKGSPSFFHSSEALNLSLSPSLPTGYWASPLPPPQWWLHILLIPYVCSLLGTVLGWYLPRAELCFLSRKGINYCTGPTSVATAFILSNLKLNVSGASMTFSFPFKMFSSLFP